MRMLALSGGLFDGYSLAGCGAQLSKADLGTVVFEVPKVAGTEGAVPDAAAGPAREWKG